MASPPSPPEVPRSPHGPDQVRPERPGLARRACLLVLLGLPFLAVAVLAMGQIVTDSYPRTDATLAAIAGQDVPVSSIGAMSRWNSCVQRRLQRRLEWFWPVNWSTVDRAMSVCEQRVNDPALALQITRARARVAPLWDGTTGVADR